MNKQTIEETFWKMCEETDDFERENLDTPLLEPYLLNILNFVKNNPEHEALFKEFFVQIGNRKKPHIAEILLYCMRELRYPEVKEAVNRHFKELGGPSKVPRLIGFVSDINWVYEEEPWEDAIFFKYHWEREHPNEPWPISNSR